MTPLIRKRHRNIPYPRRPGNRFELLIDGELFFAAMLAAIETASCFIFFEQYLVASGVITSRFIDALTQAARRGVKVYCLFDDYGCRQLSKKDRQILQRAGIQLHSYNPLLLKQWHRAPFRDHRKLLLIDGQTAFVGGCVLTDDFLAIGTPSTSWHDVMLKIKGPVLQDWQHLFQTAWQHATGNNLFMPTPEPQQQPEGQTGQVLVNQPLLQGINRATINHIRLAKRRIWITTPYFIPTSKLRRRLRRAARKGLDVRLLLPSEHSDHPWVTRTAGRHYQRLLHSGVRIFEYRPRFTHAKIVLCDDWVSIGSSNLDRWNQRWNLDANQSLQDVAFAKIVMAMFATDFGSSDEIERATWSQRPIRQRIREWSLGHFVSVLERVSRYFPRRRD